LCLSRSLSHWRCLLPLLRCASRGIGLLPAPLQAHSLPSIPFREGKAPSAPWPPALLLRSLGFVSLYSLRSLCSTSLAPSSRKAPRREGSGFFVPMAPGQHHHTAPLRCARGDTTPTPPPGPAPLQTLPLRSFVPLSLAPPLAPGHRLSAPWPRDTLPILAPDRAQGSVPPKEG